MLIFSMENPCYCRRGLLRISFDLKFPCLIRAFHELTGYCLGPVFTSALSFCGTVHCLNAEVLSTVWCSLP